MGHARLHLLRRLGPVVVAALLAGGSALGQDPGMARAFAHNDYQHARPLLDALNRGFNAVEADVHLRQGRLLVGHDSTDLRPERTLEALYLDPLRAWVGAHGGRVQRTGSPMLLLVDMKTAAGPTYAALEQVLARYQDLVASFRRDSISPAPVLVVVSGNRPRRLMERMTIRHAAYDGRLDDLRRRQPAPPAFMPLVSDEWKRVSAWDGRGRFPAHDSAALLRIVRRAHAQHRRLRFWGAPDQASIWRVQYDAGVDFINTDDLDGLRAFLLRQHVPSDSLRRG